jgi:hypothetical protein
MLMLAMLAASSIWWWMLIASALLALAYNLSSRPSAKAGKHELLAFARSFRYDVQRSDLNSALCRSINDSNAPTDIKELAKRSALGELSQGSYTHCADSNISELAAIIVAGIQGGADIRNNLDQFISRLESDIENGNRADLNSLNMDGLSSVGVSFFVPMFGGIASSIISGSASINGMQAQNVVIGFQAVIIIYVAVMSYLMDAFKNSANKDPLFMSFQAAVIGAGIIKASSSFISYAI